MMKLNLQRFGANASKSTSLYSSSHPSTYPYTLAVSLKENSTNTQNNTSSITITASLTANGQYWSTSYNSTMQLYWYDNKTSTETLEKTYTFAGMSGLYDTKSTGVTFDVTHNNDGTLSGYAKVVFTKGSTTSSNAPSNGNVQTNLTPLTSIARVSVIACTSPYVGDTAIITINRSDNTYTDTISYAIGSLTGIIATKTSNTTLSLDTSSMVNSIYTQMGSSNTSLQGTITVETFNANDNSLGTNPATFYVYAKESDCKPTITATIVDTNATTTALTGDNNTLITGYSNAQVTYTITPRQNATITTQTINNTTLGASPYTINGVRTNEFNIVATDSRGFTTTESITKSYVNYVDLALNINAMYRTAPASNEVKANFQGTYFNDTFGSQTNTLTLGWKYRVKGTSTWTNGGTLTAGTDYTISNNTFYSGTGGSASDIVIDSNVFSYNNVYEVAITYQDKLINSFTYKAVPKGVPVVNWEDEHFNVNGDLTICDTDGNNSKNVYDGIIIEQGSNATGNYIKYGNGTMITWQDWSIGAVSIGTSWGGVYGSSEISPPDFPATFYSAPSVYIEKKTGSGANFWIMKNGTTSTTNMGKVQLIRGTSVNVSSGTYLTITAIGRWKQ